MNRTPPLRRLTTDQAGQMAVEMALITPVYVLLMFIVFVYGDWFVIANRVDLAAITMTRGEGRAPGQGGVSRTQAQQEFLDPLVNAGFGTIDASATQEPTFDDSGTGFLEAQLLAFGHGLVQQGSVGSCDEDPSLRTRAFAISRYLDRGLQRNLTASRRAQAQFRYDRHQHTFGYSGNTIIPRPAIGAASAGTMVRRNGNGIMEDTASGPRRRGSWNLHPIGDLPNRLRFVTSTSPPYPFVFGLNPWVVRHFGWQGFDWKNGLGAFETPGPVFSTIDNILVLTQSPPRTFHPVEGAKDNTGLRFDGNSLEKIGF